MNTHDVFSISELYLKFKYSLPEMINNNCYFTLYMFFYFHIHLKIHFDYFYNILKTI